MTTRAQPRQVVLRPLAFAIAAIALPGCKVGPNYERPTIDPPPPSSYRDGPAEPDAASIADLAWWEVFKDEALQLLIRDALARNNDLRAAIARIQQARAIEVQTISSIYPQVGYNAAAARGRNAVLGAPTPNDGSTTSSGLLTLNVFWEIDLWGRIRRADEAALALILASEEARRGIMLSLVTDVAQAYIELLELDLEIDIANENVESFNQSLDLFTRRAAGGVDSRLQVLRAQANLAQVAATIPDLQRLVAIKENQINLLLGHNPGPVARGKRLLEQEFPVDIPAGLPSALLERRPDIRQAEQQLIAANAEIGVATADYFPRIGLTALFGKVSSDLSSFGGGASNAWSVAASLSGPIFTAGRTKAQVDQARARWEEVVANYDQTVRVAFGEVANTLITRQKLEGIQSELQVRVGALSESVSVSRQRYDVGRANYFEILDAQQQFYPAETSLAQTKGDRFIAVIQLYKALGGGWNLQTQDWSGPAASAGAPEGASQPGEGTSR